MNWIWWILAYIVAGLLVNGLAGILVMLASYMTPGVNKDQIETAMDAAIPDYSEWPTTKFIFWFCVDTLAWPVSAMVAAIILLTDIKDNIIEELTTKVED